MYKVIVMCFKLFFRLLALLLLGCVLLVLRYIFRTPQTLESTLSGEAHLYKWTYGQVYYQIMGSEGAPPLVLVHAPGIGASSYEMRGIVNDLSHYYRVYVLDLLGFGLSDAPTIAYSADTYVALLTDFLTAVVGRSAILLASGLSCQYCAAVAATRPELCNGLVLVSPFSLSSQRYQSRALTFIAGLPFFGLALYALLSMRLLLAEPRGDQKQAREQRRNHRFVVANQPNADRAGSAFLAGRLALGYNAARALAVSPPTQPVLELWGMRRLQDVQAHALQEFATPHTQVVLLRDVGSQVVEEQPEAVVTHLLKWAGQCDAAQQTEPLVHDEVLERGKKEQETQEAQEVEVVQGGNESRVEVGEDVEARGSIEEVVKVEEEVKTVEGEVVGGIDAYCAKCRQKRMMLYAKLTVTKTGRNALEGVCPVCGTRLFRFISNQKENNSAR